MEGSGVGSAAWVNLARMGCFVGVKLYIHLVGVMCM